MDPKTKRIARRILLIHLLLLGVVLALVAGAAREIYTKTREQLIAQAQDRQDLLARQTATGIQGHYQSILNDLDLLHREENGQSTTAPTTPETQSSQPTGTDGRQPGPDGHQPGPEGRVPGPNGRQPDPRQADPAQSRAPIIGIVMWTQLKGRVSLLFSIDHAMNRRMMLDASRNPPQVTAQDTTNLQLHVIGSADDRINVLEVLHRNHQWIDQLKEPSLNPFETYNGVGVNVVCIPMARGRDLIAVVPIKGIEDQYLKPLKDDPVNGAWLIDEAGTAMAASRPELVGTGVASISDPQVQSLAQQMIANHGAGNTVINRNFAIGEARFAPAMITARPVKVANKQWELFVTTSLSDVNGVAAGLMHEALIWCIFVVLSFTAILVSTAVWMIRSRLRMERLRHDSLTRELGQARQIQLAWLPHALPHGESIDIAAINSPASHISGDFYNWFELPDGRMVVLVGDVTGHGMSAAFLMATSQLLVRNTMMRLTDPGRCLEEVNRQLCVQVFNGQFVTMVLAVLDLQRGQMQIATAGHPAPLLGDGESFQPVPLEPQLVLGVDRETRYVSETFDLPPQASLLLYTDGVVECPDNQYDRFGDERLRRTLYGRYEAARDMLKRVMMAVDEFRGSRVLDDDLTMVAVQLQPVRSEASTTALEV